MSKRITSKFRVVYRADGFTPLPGFFDQDGEPIYHNPHSVTYAPDYLDHDEHDIIYDFNTMVAPKKEMLRLREEEEKRLREEEKRLREEEEEKSKTEGGPEELV